MSTPSVVRIYPQPVLAQVQPGFPTVTYAVRPEPVLTPQTPLTQLVQDAWFGLSAATGQVRLRSGEIIGIKFAEDFGPRSGILAATIGQYMGRHYEPHEVALALPDSEPGSGYYVGDPTFSVAMRDAVANRRPPNLKGRHTQLVKMVEALLPAVEGIKEGTPCLLGRSSMPPPTAMAAGWVMGSLFPKIPMQLQVEDSGEIVTCSQSLVLAPTRPPVPARTVVIA